MSSRADKATDSLILGVRSACILLATSQAISTMPKGTRTVHNPSLLRLKRSTAPILRHPLLLSKRRFIRHRNIRLRRSMFNLLLPTTVPLTKTQRSGEDRPPPLSSLHGPRNKAPAVAHPLDMIKDGNFRVTCENEVTVHAMDGKVRRNGSHGCREGLGYRGAAVYAAGSGRVPEGPGVGEDILHTCHCVSKYSIGTNDSCIRKDIPARCRQRASVPAHFRSGPWRDPVLEVRTMSHF